VSNEAEARPFRIEVPQNVLDDLRERLSRTRWTDEVEGAGWDYGTNLGYLRELIDYWRDEFEWRIEEAKLNELAHFKADIGGFGVHFIHERGKGPDPLPLLLLHGWPDSFYRFHRIIPMLTDPEKYGGDPADSFDVVAPSLPGFGFSNRPKERGWNTAQDAGIFEALMTEVLGYERYAAHGGDGGSPISQLLAGSYPGSVVGIHLTDIGWDKAMQLDPSTLSETERRYMRDLEASSLEEGGYVMIQGSRPQTLGYGLNDSPVGLAAWIVEKFRSWSDCDGDVERSFTKDELLTNISIYWVTQTINSSIRPYYEGMHSWSDPNPRVEAPVGMALFPKDNPPPRETAERFLNLQRWTEMPRGGHFTAMEEPELLAEDIRAYFRDFR
jgi:microsomal epoxide hydrolase